MDIYVLNAPDSIVGMIQNFESAIWNCEYFGPSDCEINLPGTQENMDLSPRKNARKRCGHT